MSTPPSPARSLSALAAPSTFTSESGNGYSQANGDAIDGGDQPDLDVPLYWVLLLIFCCCCGIAAHRSWCQASLTTRATAAGCDEDEQESLTGMGDDEVKALVQRVRRIVGCELRRSGLVEFNCLDDEGNEYSLDRRDLLQDGGDAQRLMVERYEARYPLPAGYRSQEAAATGLVAPQASPPHPPEEDRRRWDTGSLQGAQPLSRLSGKN